MTPLHLCVHTPPPHTCVFACGRVLHAPHSPAHAHRSPREVTPQTRGRPSGDGTAHTDRCHPTQHGRLGPAAHTQTGTDPRQGRWPQAGLAGQAPAVPLPRRAGNFLATRSHPPTLASCGAAPPAQPRSGAQPRHAPRRARGLCHATGVRSAPAPRCAPQGCPERESSGCCRVHPNPHPGPAVGEGQEEHTRVHGWTPVGRWGPARLHAASRERA